MTESHKKMPVTNVAGVRTRKASQVDKKLQDQHVAWLLAVAQDRDRAAYAQLFAYYAPRLTSFAMRGNLSQNAAEEVMQETMIAVWRKAHSFDPRKASVSTWVFTIVRNKRIDFLRKEARPDLTEDDFAHVETTVDAADSVLIALQRSETVRERLKNLPDVQKEVIQKAFFEDKSHSEVAEDLGLPLGTIKSRIRLALGRLRGLITADMIEAGEDDPRGNDADGSAGQEN